MFTVTFEYHEASKMWEVIVRGAKDRREAIEGFNAVLATTRLTGPSMVHRADLEPDGSYKIIVAV